MLLPPSFPAATPLEQLPSPAVLQVGSALMHPVPSDSDMQHEGASKGVKREVHQSPRVSSVGGAELAGAPTRHPVLWLLPGCRLAR